MLFAMSTSLELGAIVYLTVACILCPALPLTMGFGKGHVVLGIIGALITLPCAALLGCIGGLPVACVFSLVIFLVPVPNKPLLSQTEIEYEMRRIRGE